MDYEALIKKIAAALAGDFITIAVIGNLTDEERLYLAPIMANAKIKFDLDTIILLKELAQGEIERKKSDIDDFDKDIKELTEKLNAD